YLVHKMTQHAVPCLVGLFGRAVEMRSAFFAMFQMPFLFEYPDNCQDAVVMLLAGQMVLNVLYAPLAQFPNGPHYLQLFVSKGFRWLSRHFASLIANVFIRYQNNNV